MRNFPRSAPFAASTLASPLRPLVQNAYRPPSSFGLFPPVVKNLLILNGLAFLAQVIFEARTTEPFDAITRLFALWPIGGPEAIQFRDGLVQFGTFQPWQLVTSAFLHGGFGHILFNLFGLWMFGGAIERVMAAFGLLYPESPIYLLFFPVPIPAKWFVLGYAAFSLFAGVTDVQAGVAHFAHLGGMLTGAVVVLYWLGRLPIRPRTRPL